LKNFLLFSAAFFLLAACSDSIKGGKEAVISLHLSGGNDGRAATAFPPDDEILNRLEYEVELSGSSDVQTHKFGGGALTARITVAAGLWDITVRAFLEADLYAEGFANVNVIAGQNNPVSIKMYYAGITDEEDNENKTDEDDETYYIVTFNSRGGTTVAQIDGVVYGTTIAAPAIPVKSGYDSFFEGWYTEDDLITAWKFQNDIVTDNITLYAKWRPYELGETGPGGGVIFYRDENGFTMTDDNSTAYYFEASPDISEVGRWNNLRWWSNGKATILLNNSTAIGEGRNNTARILLNDENAPAAKKCVDYRGNNYSDWFLPSREELTKLYNYVISVSSPILTFWASSEYDTDNAHTHDFSNGARAYVPKTTMNNVWTRAIRAF